MLILLLPNGCCHIIAATTSIPTAAWVVGVDDWMETAGEWLEMSRRKIVIFCGAPAKSVEEESEVGGKMAHDLVSPRCLWTWWTWQMNECQKQGQQFRNTWMACEILGGWKWRDVIGVKIVRYFACNFGEWIDLHSEINIIWNLSHLIRIHQNA